MKTIPYKNCEIRSTPFNVVKGPYKYSVNGVIQINSKKFIYDIPADLLGVSNEEWLHATEDEADAIFIKYAKIWIKQYRNRLRENSERPN